MDRTAFYAAIRPAFGKALSHLQVDGIEALLNAGRGLPLHHMANVLAQVRRETGGIMAPIKETVLPSHKEKNPSDAVVIRRLDAAWAKGRLKGVKAPYWRNGEFGRGQIQLTHARNRAAFGITNPDDLLKPTVSARVAVEGMRDGRFRTWPDGRPIRLSDFDFPAALDLPPARNPRRIVNGQDGSDREVARYHRAFAAALQQAGWGTAPPVRPDAAAIPAAPSGGGWIIATLTTLTRMFGDSK